VRGRIAARQDRRQEAEGFTAEAVRIYDHAYGPGAEAADAARVLLDSLRHAPVRVAAESATATPGRR
jgi:hypothetical protein